VFEPLSSSIGWRLTVLQSSARKVAHAGLTAWQVLSVSNELRLSVWD